LVLKKETLTLVEEEARLRMKRVEFQAPASVLARMRGRKVRE